MNIKGLSTIVSTIILVLIVLSAIAIIWGPIKELSDNSANSVSIAQPPSNIVIKSVRANFLSNTILVRVKNNPSVSSLNITSLKFIVSDEFDSDTFLVKIPGGFQELEEKTFSLNLNGKNVILDNLKRVEVIPAYTNSEGNEYFSMFTSDSFKVKNISYNKIGDLHKKNSTSGSKNQNNSSDYSDVLLVTNLNSQDSIAISSYYLKTRNITHQINLSITTEETINFNTFNNSIRKPIEDYLKSNNLVNSINYIVLTKGIPLGTDTSGGCKSVDSMLTLILSNESKNIGGSTSDCWSYSGRVSNPMFLQTHKASKTYYDIYIVARLDGYTVQDIENAMGPLSIYKNTGKILLDKNTNPGYAFINSQFDSAYSVLSDKGIPVVLESTANFSTNQDNLSGYYSFGSNDPNASANSSSWNLKFNPGSIGDTEVSTSGRTFYPVNSYYSPTVGANQSLVADLIAGGLSFVKGYYSEPYASAISKPYISLDRYTSNYTAGESMYMGSAFLNWKDVYVGDPKIRLEVN